MVTSDGLVYAHAGEQFVPRNRRSGGGGGIVIQIGGATIGAGQDPRVAARIAGAYTERSVLTSFRMKKAIRQAVDFRLQ